MMGVTAGLPGTPAVTIVVRGLADPPDPDRPAEIVADWRTQSSDGRTDFGSLHLVKVGGR